MNWAFQLTKIINQFVKIKNKKTIQIVLLYQYLVLWWRLCLFGWRLLWWCLDDDLCTHGCAAALIILPSSSSSNLAVTMHLVGVEVWVDPVGIDWVRCGVSISDPLSVL